MKHAYIENGKVKEVARVDPFSIFQPSYAALFVPCPDDVEAGWTVDGEQWLPPAPPAPVVPQRVTMRQARLAMLAAGLLDDVAAAIATLPSPQKEAAQIEWEYSQEVQRHNGVLLQLAPALRLDDAAIDALFTAAAGL